MDFSNILDFARVSRDRVSEEGIGGVAKSARDVHESALRHGVSRVYWPEGTPVFEEDWDVLLVLDACRADLLAAVRDEYEFLDAPDTRLSVDSTSHRWMEKNFSAAYADDLRETAYVTGNPSRTASSRSVSSACSTRPGSTRGTTTWGRSTPVRSPTALSRSAATSTPGG